MLLTELIERLQVLLESAGDCEVRISGKHIDAEDIKIKITCDIDLNEEIF
jgi:hypothetical protein